MAKVTVTLPNNATFVAADGTVYRFDDVFEVEQDELVEARIRVGNLIEVKKPKKPKS
jgi:hypothetical protein